MTTSPTPDGTVGGPRIREGDVPDVALNRGLLLEFLKERAGFQFAVAVIDGDRAREAAIRDLTVELAAEGVVLLTIDLWQLPEDVVLLTAIKEALAGAGDGQHAVAVVGLERHLDLRSGGSRDKPTALLFDANFQRDAFPELCPVPLVLWVTSLALPAVARMAPDLWHWRAGTFDLCEDGPDVPFADRLERIVPRPAMRWEAQPKEELHRRIALLGELLAEVGPDSGERRIRLLLERAEALFDAGDYTGSRQAGEEALALAKELDAYQLQAKCFCLLGHVRKRSGDFDGALHDFEDALSISKIVNNKSLASASLIGIARLKALRGATKEALCLFEDVLAINETLGDVRGQGIALFEIARLKERQGDIDEALQLFEKVLIIDESLGDKIGRGSTLLEIARLKAGQGSAEEAAGIFEEVISIAEEVGDVHGRAIALGEIARLKYSGGAVDEALSLFNQALHIFDGLGGVRERAVVLSDIARLKASQGAVEEAIQLFEEVFKISQGLGDPNGEANSRWSLANLRRDEIFENDGKLSPGEVQKMFNDYSFAYHRVKELRNASGIAAVGLDFARALAMIGLTKEARALAEQSCALFSQIHWDRERDIAQRLLDTLPPDDGRGDGGSAATFAS